MNPNYLLMQLQSHSLDQNVERGTIIKTTGLGADYLAALGSGIFKYLKDLEGTWKLDRKFATN